MDNNLKLENQFLDIRNISVTAADYLDNELYRTDTTDDVQPADILKELYAILIDELAELGVYFSTDEETLLEDFYTAKNIYYLRKLVDVSTLTEMFTSNEEYKNKTEMLLNDVELDSDFISEFIELTSAYFNTKEGMSRLMEIYIEVYSDIQLRKHMEAILENITQLTKTADNIEETEIAAFTDLLIENRQKFIECTDRLAQALISFTDFNEAPLEVDYSIISKEAAIYDRDKFMNMNAWMILEDDEVSDDIKAYYHDIWLDHHANNLHHIEYYLTRNIIPVPSEIILLLAHFDEVGATKESVDKGILELKEIGNNILTSDNLKLIDFLQPFIFEG